MVNFNRVVLGGNLTRDPELRFTQAGVKVLETDRRAELRGMLGTIEHRFGHPEYLTLDVRLDDGQLELFWAHGLESAEEAEKALRA
jgi:hypothetical protein